MARFFARFIALSGAVLLATAMPVLAQSGQTGSDDRSNNAQSDDQTTSESQQNDQNQSSDQARSQQQGRQWQDEQRNRILGDRNRSDDEQSRRADRQEQRQDRRQLGGRFSNDDSDPAIGVTVVERGGIGVRVMGVAQRSPAAQAGIRPGDTILEVNGRRVDSAPQLVSVIQESEAGETAELAVVREGREYQVEVRLSTRERVLPDRLRQAGSEDQQGQQGQQQYGQSDQNRQQGQAGQTWQQGDQQYGQQDRQYQQQYGQRQSDQQQGQYGQANQYSRQGQGQYGQSQQGQYRQQGQERYSGQSGSTQQAYYGAQDPNYSQQSQYRSQANQREPIGERLAQRLIQFESRLERLTQRLEQLERSGGVKFEASRTGAPENSTDAESSSEDQQGEDSSDESE
jgi:hypothetical protein